MTPGATYSQPASITLTATATDPEANPIAKMEFLRGSTVIATLTTAPYTLQANASDPDGSVTMVEFLQNGQVLSVSGGLTFAG